MMNIVTLFLLTLSPAVAIQEASLPVFTDLIVAEKHELVLFYTTYCPYCQKVLNYLKKIHKTLPMKNLENDLEAKEELKRIGGKMQVPCLLIDGKALYDSDAIIEWLSKHQSDLDPT